MGATFFMILIGPSTKVQLGVSEIGDGLDKIMIILICAAYGDIFACCAIGSY